MKRPSRTVYPDPDRLGGLAWARRSQGNLSEAERRTLLGRLAAAQQRAIARATEVATGGQFPRAVDDPHQLEPPDSKFAREAERQAATELSVTVLNHSYRTWLYAAALAGLDGIALDRELLYIGSLLHDIGLEESALGRCFTVFGAQAAETVTHRAGADPDRGAAVADAICAHITPGVSSDEDGTLAPYIQAGSMADFAGLRIAEVPETLRSHAQAHFPEHEGAERIIALLAAQAEAVPDGRVALYMSALRQ